jgi:hypothetical protein
MLHDTKPLRCVAFEGSGTGRRFYGCAVKVSHLRNMCYFFIESNWLDVGDAVYKKD